MRHIKPKPRIKRKRLRKFKNKWITVRGRFERFGTHKTPHGPARTMLVTDVVRARDNLSLCDHAWLSYHRKKPVFFGHGDLIQFRARVHRYDNLDRHHGFTLSRPSNKR